MYQIHHNSRSFHFSFSTRNQLFFSFRHDKMNRKFLTHALIGGIYEHFRTDPAIRTHYHRILRKPPAAVLRCHRRRSSLDRSCRETVDAGKRKYLKRLHSGGRETPSDIPDEQYLRPKFVYKFHLCCLSKIQQLSPNLLFSSLGSFRVAALF